MSSGCVRGRTSQCAQPGVLGKRTSVIGISPATWDRKMCDTGLHSNKTVRVRGVRAVDFLFNLLSDCGAFLAGGPACVHFVQESQPCGHKTAYVQQHIWKMLWKWKLRRIQHAPWPTGLASLQTRRGQVELPGNERNYCLWQCWLARPGGG